MTVSTLESSPLVPTHRDVVQASEIAEYMRDARARGEAVEVTMRGPNGAVVTLPKLLTDLLAAIVDETSGGHSVQIVSADRQVTPNEAADILNVSRPYVVRLMNEGQLPFLRVGSHRRLLASDVFAYKQKQIAESRDAMRELNELSRELGMGYS